MHELPATENLLDLALKHAEKANANRIKDINIVIGQLASIIDDSVKFYWDIISKDTIAEGALLHFHRIQTKFLCKDCNYTFSPSDENFECPNCSAVNIQIIAGREFYLDSIEIE